MTSRALQRLQDAADVLTGFPDLPEPHSVSVYPDMRPTIMWQVDEETARSIVAAVHPVAQGDRVWDAYVYDDKPQTIAHCRVAGVDLNVVVDAAISGLVTQAVSA